MHHMDEEGGDTAISKENVVFLQNYSPPPKHMLSGEESALLGISDNPTMSLYLYIQRTPA